jgi:osmotically-inducible protein OsmY
MEIQSDIAQELRWDPRVRHDDIAALVRDGVVTLAGTVPNYGDRTSAERIAGRIRGVRAIANEITVRLPAVAERSDTGIARAVLHAFLWHSAVPDDRIMIKVEQGWVTLEGEVDWYYQKEAAENAVKVLMGVRGITNIIAVRATPLAGDVRQSISAALHRAASIDADRVAIDIEGDVVALRGTVRSYAERRDIERAVRNARGVTAVRNDLAVNPTLLAEV